MRVSSTSPTRPTTTRLTWNGITLYGTVDIGVAYQNHGAPLSQDFYPTLQYMIGSSSNKSITTIASNGLSQSKVGVTRQRGAERRRSRSCSMLEMGFNPTSGKLADAPKSLINNNGIALADRKTAGDGSRAGQFFNGAGLGRLQFEGLGHVDDRPPDHAVRRQHRRSTIR